MNILPKFMDLLHVTIFMATLLVATALYKEKMSIGEGIISIVLLLILVCVSRLNIAIDTHTKVSIPSKTN